MDGLTILNSLANLLSQQQGIATTTTTPRHKTQYSSATCLDPECQTTLYFPSHEASVECPTCGQRHTVGDLPDRKEISGKDNSFRVELAQLRQSYKTGKKTPELVKVKGISNYQCKLLSPSLTLYGMDKSDNAKTLEELGMGTTFDCGKLASRAFAIDESHFKVVGYGRDRSGSERYLQDTLKEVQVANENTECLVPVHADGDGHCLVHAISRCLVGRELFWHALRTNLYDHLTSKQKEYAEMFKDFISDEEWKDIIAESAPDFQPPDAQSLGLRNIHVFGLANVLKRPIVLLDSLSGMRSKGDYSGLFLPTLSTPEECSSKGGTLNSPIVIAWSSSGRNHFIPLLPVKGRPLPKLPPTLRPKVWGADESILSKYVVLDELGAMTMCAGKELADSYLARLVACMERLFFEKHEVVPSLVAEFDHFVYKSVGCVGVSADILISSTHLAVGESRLFRCLICSGLTCVPGEWLVEGGMLYNKAADNLSLEDKETYNFPFDGVTAKYDEEKNQLVPVELSCSWCMQMTRRVLGSGRVVYENGDRTDTISHGSRCGCGYMHYWDGKEYDNLPEKVPLKLTWAGCSKEISAHWFQYESDPARNSNVYEVAQKALNDNFPGEFGSERLAQEIVDRILAVTATKENLEQVTGLHPPTVEKVQSSTSPTTPTTPTKDESAETPPAGDVSASKIIMVGPKSRTLHKEELTASETERRVRRRIEENARQQQMRGRSGRGPEKPPPIKITKSLTPPPPAKTTPPRPTGDSPSPTSQPAKKRIKVTSSDGKTANLTLELSVTFSELQEAIAKELSIPPERQRLRSGFPPKELKPGPDPAHPLELANGERVSVDIIEIKAESPIPIAKSVRGRNEVMDRDEEAGKTLNTLMQLLRGESVDFWLVGQNQPAMFERGGEYYQQVVDQYGGQLKTGTHLQFREFPNKVFAFNAEKQRLELCLGLQHMAIAPLTPDQEKLALAAAQLSATPTTTGDHHHHHQETHPHNDEGSGFSGGAYKGPVNKIKAFSGKGQTLSSSGTSDMGGASDVGGASESSARGAKRPKRRAEDVRSDEDSLMETAQMVAKRLANLQSREKDLQLQVRTLNRELVNAEYKQDGASVRDDLVTSLESRLLDYSSELKQVREHIKELTTADTQ